MSKLSHCIVDTCTISRLALNVLATGVRQTMDKCVQTIRASDGITLQKKTDLRCRILRIGWGGS